MNTYIIKAQGYYKIGKSANMKKRLETYDTCNPVYELIHVIEFNCEVFLHKFFFHRHFKAEWYSLTWDDIMWIKTNEQYLWENSSDNTQCDYEKTRKLSVSRDISIKRQSLYNKQVFLKEQEIRKKEKKEEDKLNSTKIKEQIKKKEKK